MTNLSPRRNWMFFSLAILTLGAGWIAISAALFKGSTHGFIPAPQVSFLSPDFSLPDSTGSEIKLSDLRGQAVLLNFWGSWCPPCKAEMPAMQEVFQEYRSRGFTILAVNAAFQEQPGAAAAFLVKNDFDFPILYDQLGEVFEQYQIQAFPTSYFIAPDGIIREVVIGGPMAEALLRTRIEKILGEAR